VGVHNLTAAGATGFGILLLGLDAASPANQTSQCHGGSGSTGL